MKRVPAGSVEELRDGRARLVALSPREQRPRQAIVLLDEGGVPRAYLNECRHIPVPLDGGSGVVLDHTKRFLMCGTHGALYEKQTGLCVLGPCRGQRLLPIEIEVSGDSLTLID